MMKQIRQGLSIHSSVLLAIGLDY